MPRRDSQPGSCKCRNRIAKAAAGRSAGVCAHAVYVSGCRSAAEARAELDRRLAALEGAGKPAGAGPTRTTLAQGLQAWAMERLPFMKAAARGADRINRYLRAGGVAVLKVSPCSGPLQAAAGTPVRRHVVTPDVLPADRPIPPGLTAHRARQANETAEADRRRAVLMRMPVAQVQPYHVQAFLDALHRAGRSAATLQLERAVLRSFFNHARRVWRWSEPRDNPATHLRLPKVANGRDRVMSRAEERRLDEALASCHNSLVAPVLRLLTETAMRSSEPLLRAAWRDVDWDAKLLRLRESKTDARDVPLSPRAIEALEELRRLNPGDEHGPLVRITYEALKAAWQRACARAGIEGLKLHDLRHTAATRFALTTGNVFLVQALTGHKTVSQLARYVNVKASDVVDVMHAQAPVSVTDEMTEDAMSNRSAKHSDGTVVWVDFARRSTG